jgi:hypothetical protein
MGTGNLRNTSAKEKLMNKLLPLIVICVSWAQLSLAQTRLGNDTVFSFATVDEGRQILTARDEFVRQMSPFDRSARLKTDADISVQQYLDFAGSNVLAWTGEEKQKIVSAFDSVRTDLDSLCLALPRKVFLIKTTGIEEGGADYTRANAIIFPENNLAAPVSSIRKTFCHELFHVISRFNPDLRGKLYAMIGFIQCSEVELPPDLRSRKITNPDAPVNDHCIRLRVNGIAHWAIPILYSDTERYDKGRGGEFFDYLRFRFLLVERKDDSLHVDPVYPGVEPQLQDIQQVSGFYEQVGRNTGYIIHPEEILADNFALLVQRKQDLPSPDLIAEMKEILKSNRAGCRKDSSDRK